MDTGHFINLCVKKGISILPYNDTTLNNYKKLTGRFNYLCDFDENGACRDSMYSTCCCSSCKYHVGYMRTIRDAANRIEEYAHKYNEVTGFWRPNIGCVLPLKMRSSICVSFICSTTRSGFKDRNGTAIMTFMNLLYSYNSLSLKEQEGIHKLYTHINNTL